MSFMGYPRPDGQVGVRNYVGVFATVGCANDVVNWIVRDVPGCAPFTHEQGCAQISSDMDTVHNTLVSLGYNPNLAAVLLVRLGCEGEIDDIYEGIKASGKPVAKIEIQKMGGASIALKEGVRIASQMVADAAKIKKQEFDDSKLMFGIKCGGSDTTSGLVSNPAVGAACDILIENGGRCIFGETTEMIGAEHFLARRAASPEVKARILEIVNRMEKRSNDFGVDVRGANPTRGNIAAGLTTLEEKSIGAISKGGTKQIRGVCEYGERHQGEGLFLVDGPGQEARALPPLAAAGSQIMLFSTGIGAPQGFPFVPVVKVTANPQTAEHLAEHIDVYTGIDTSADIRKLGQIIYEEALAVASGKETKAEKLGYTHTTDIWCNYPIF